MCLVVGWYLRKVSGLEGFPVERWSRGDQKHQTERAVVSKKALSKQNTDTHTQRLLVSSAVSPVNDPLLGKRSAPQKAWRDPSGDGGATTQSGRLFKQGGPFQSQEVRKPAV